MGNYKRPSEDEFEFEGETLVHKPTGAKWWGYDGDDYPSSKNRGRLGDVLANGDDYRPHEVEEMAYRLFAKHFGR